jgi:hypothetical protein
MEKQNILDKMVNVSNQIAELKDELCFYDINHDSINLSLTSFIDLFGIVLCTERDCDKYPFEMEFKYNNKTFMCIFDENEFLALTGKTPILRKGE